MDELRVLAVEVNGRLVVRHGGVVLNIRVSRKVGELIKSNYNIQQNEHDVLMLCTMQITTIT